MSEHVQVFDEFWRDLVTDGDGNLVLDLVQRELYDYHYLLEQVPTVYCHITGDRMSKPGYDAHDVITVADEYNDTLVRREVATTLGYLADDVEGLSAGDTIARLRSESAQRSDT